MVTYSLTILSLYEYNTNVKQRGISLQTTLLSAFIRLAGVCGLPARIQYYKATLKGSLGEE